MLNQSGQDVPEAVLAKIKKLQALSMHNANEHEAAAAAAKMQELLFKYELEVSQVEGVDLDAKPVQEDKIVVNDGHRGVNWKMTIFSAVARTSMCKELVSWYTYDANKTRTMGYLIGRPADIEMAKFTFSYLVNELTRLCDIYVHNYTGFDHRTRVRNSWLTGAANAVSKKLMHEFNERRGDSQESMALVELKDAAIQTYLAAHYPNLRGTYSSTAAEYVNSAAYNAGYQTGSQLGSRRALSATSSTKQLREG